MRIDNQYSLLGVCACSQLYSGWFSKSPKNTIAQRATPGLTCLSSFCIASCHAGLITVLSNTFSMASPGKSTACCSWWTISVRLSSVPILSPGALSAIARVSAPLS